MDTDGLRAAARFARHLPDRLLHGRRRTAASGRLRRLGRPRTVLFLCHGNICRSPFAAAVARRLAPAGMWIESAGFIGPDRPSPAYAVAAAREFGADLSSHRSQLVTPALLEAADLVVVMDRAQRRKALALRPALRGRVVLLGDLDPEPIARRVIPDPVDRSPDFFRSSYARVERCTRALLSLWNGGAAQEPRG